VIVDADRRERRGPDLEIGRDLAHRLYRELVPGSGGRVDRAGLTRVFRALTFMASKERPPGAAFTVPRAWPWFRGSHGGQLRVAREGAGAVARWLRLSGGQRTSLDDLYQDLLAVDPAPARSARATERRKMGAFYTRRTIAHGLVDATLHPLLRERSPVLVCDPACGSGRFLIASASEIGYATGLPAERAVRFVYGVDLDPVAAELCRYLIAQWAGVEREQVAGNIRCGNPLIEPAPAHWPEKFDAVVGNPPFLNQLESGTARAKAFRAALAERFGGAIRPYTDTSAVFLLLALDIVRPGGRIMLIQPLSFLAARDAGGVRAALAARASLNDLWTAEERVFSASVHVCAPLCTVGAPQRVFVGRLRTAAVTPSKARARAADATPDSWAPYAADLLRIPRHSTRAAGTLADYADATADFRDQFYGLRGCIVEDGDCDESQRRAFPRLITTGLIGPGVCFWGLRACRLLGQKWRAPRADPAALERAGLGAWVRQRLVPKVLMASQTRTLEAIVDTRGDALPVTPIITIVPRDPALLGHIASAILSPVATAWALLHFAGTGLGPGAIKVSARQVLALPVPARNVAWDRAAAEVLKGVALGATGAGAAADTDPMWRSMATLFMLLAYETREPRTGALVQWWRGRLDQPPRGPRPDPDAPRL
jgi:SAM-dependent methyltransferase